MSKTRRSKQKPLFGLAKLPTKAYIKSLEDEITRLNVEKGKDTSYIYELEDELKKLKSLDKDILVEYKKQEYIKSLQKKISQLGHKIYTITRDNKKLIEKNINLKKEIDG